MFGEKTKTTPIVLAGDDSQDLPKRTVTASEFIRAALPAGWEGRSVNLFLLPGTVVAEHVKVGRELLRIKN